MRRRERFRAWMRRGGHGVAGAAVFAIALPLTLLGIEPLPVYWYLFAWYPILLIIDAVVVRRRGTSLLCDRPLALLSLFAWSVPFWLLFEVLNLRVDNWYYINAPNDPMAGRLFLLAAFATVLPGLIEVYDLIGTFRWFESSRSRPFRLHAVRRRRLALSGLLLLSLSLLIPVLFFPLIWVFLVLLVEPFNRWPRRPSLLRDLERGRPARLYRLLAAGAACGLWWELMNLPARTRWIYTVPGLDRLFVEMPPLGFLGFLPFALEAYAMLRLLELLGLSVPFEEEADGAAVVRIPVAARLFVIPFVVAAFSMASIVALETHTVDSRSTRVVDLPSAGPRETAALALRGVDQAAELISATRTATDRKALAEWLRVPVPHVERLVEEARLADHRGIGAEHLRSLAAVGVDSVTELGAQDPDELYAALSALAGDKGRFRPPRVRTWINAARLD